MEELFFSVVKGSEVGSSFCSGTETRIRPDPLSEGNSGRS